MADVTDQAASFAAMGDASAPLFEDGSCCVCGGVDNEDLILLCDNPGCRRETHMYCIWPPLSAVPEGEWLCDKCEPLGSTTFLLQYLESTLDTRACVQLANAEEYRNYIQDLSPPLDGFVPSASQSAMCEFEVGADALLGKKVSLFCPRDQRTHTGRILARRYWPELDQWEHLVLFRSGLEGRNKPLTIWIDLQEHDCMVLLEIGWIKHRAGLQGWWPAQRCARSARCFHRHHPNAGSPLTKPFYLFVEQEIHLIRSNEVQFESWNARTYPRSALARAHYLKYLQAVLEIEEQSRLHFLLSHREFVSFEDIESWMLQVDAEAMSADLSFLPQRIPSVRAEERDTLADQFVGTGYEIISQQLLRGGWTWWNSRDVASCTNRSTEVGDGVAGGPSSREVQDTGQQESKEQADLGEVAMDIEERDGEGVNEEDDQREELPPQLSVTSPSLPCASSSKNQLVDLYPFLLDPLALTAHPQSLVQWGADPSPSLPSHALQLSAVSLSCVMQRPIQRCYQAQLEQLEEELRQKKRKIYEQIQETKARNKRLRMEREEERKRKVRERLKENNEQFAMAVAEAEMRSFLEEEARAQQARSDPLEKEGGGEAGGLGTRTIEALPEQERTQDSDWNDVMVVKDQYYEVRRSGRLRKRQKAANRRGRSGTAVASAASAVDESRAEGADGDEDNKGAVAGQAKDGSSVPVATEHEQGGENEQIFRTKNRLAANYDISQASPSVDTQLSPPLLEKASISLQQPQPGTAKIGRGKDDISYFEESDNDWNLLESSSSSDEAPAIAESNEDLLEVDAPLDVLEPVGMSLASSTRDIRPPRYQKPSRTVLLEVLPTNPNTKPVHSKAITTAAISIPSSSHPSQPVAPQSATTTKHASRNMLREGSGPVAESHKPSLEASVSAPASTVAETENPAANVSSQAEGTQTQRTIKKRVVVGESSSSSSSASVYSPPSSDEEQQRIRKTDIKRKEKYHAALMIASSPPRLHHVKHVLPPRQSSGQAASLPSSITKTTQSDAPSRTQGSSHSYLGSSSSGMMPGRNSMPAMPQGSKLVRKAEEREGRSMALLPRHSQGKSTSKGAATVQSSPATDILPPDRGIVHPGAAPTSTKNGRDRRFSLHRISNWGRTEAPPEQSHFTMMMSARPPSLSCDTVNPSSEAIENTSQYHGEAKKGPSTSLPSTTAGSGTAVSSFPVRHPALSVDPRRLHRQSLQSQQGGTVTKESSMKSAEEDEDVNAFLLSFQAQHGLGVPVGSTELSGNNNEGSVSSVARAQQLPHGESMGQGGEGSLHLLHDQNQQEQLPLYPYVAMFNIATDAAGGSVAVTTYPSNYDSDCTGLHSRFRNDVALPQSEGMQLIEQDCGHSSGYCAESQYPTSSIHTNNGMSQADDGCYASLRSVSFPAQPYGDCTRHENFGPCASSLAAATGLDAGDYLPSSSGGNIDGGPFHSGIMSREADVGAQMNSIWSPSQQRRRRQHPQSLQQQEQQRGYSGGDASASTDYNVPESYMGLASSEYRQEFFVDNYSHERVDYHYSAPHVMCADPSSRLGPTDPNAMYSSHAHDSSPSHLRGPMQPFNSLSAQSAEYDASWHGAREIVESVQNRSGGPCVSSYQTTLIQSSDGSVEQQQESYRPNLGSMFELSASMGEVSTARAAQQQRHRGRPTRFGKIASVGSEIVLPFGENERSQAYSSSARATEAPSHSTGPVGTRPSFLVSKSYDGFGEDGELQGHPDKHFPSTELPYCASDGGQWASSQSDYSPFSDMAHFSQAHYSGMAAAEGAVSSGMHPMDEQNDNPSLPAYFPAQSAYSVEAGATSANVRHHLHHQLPYVQQQLEVQQQAPLQKQGHSRKRHKAGKMQARTQTSTLPSAERSYHGTLPNPISIAQSKVEPAVQKESRVEVEDGEVDG